MKKLLTFAVLCLLMAAEARAQFLFQNGNVVVSRVGDGAAVLTSAATEVFLEERSGVDGSLVQAISLHTSIPNKLTMSGTATSEGKIKFHAGYLAVAGYDANAGTASVVGTTSTAVNRKIAVFQNNGGSVSYTSLSDAYSANNIRSAISDGTNIWTAGTASAVNGPGVRHTTIGASLSTQLSTTVTNIRTVNIFDGQLFASHNAGTTSTRVVAVGTGLPTTSSQAMTNLNGLPLSYDAYDFYFADLDAGISGNDTLFLTNAATTTAGIEQFTFNGTIWTSRGLLSTGTGAFGLAGVQSGSNVELYVTTASQLQKYTLTSAWGSAFTASQNWFVTAGANTAYRGVAAVPEPTSLGLLALSAVAGLAFRRRRS
jgi:hypothetical protein